MGDIILLKSIVQYFIEAYAQEYAQALSNLVEQNQFDHYYELLQFTSILRL